MWQCERSPLKSQLEVVYRSVDELTLNSKNPRLHSKRQIRQIARSIKNFGFNVPVLVDANLNVIAGHGRVLATRELNQKVIPTISIEHLPPEKIRAFLIADNKICENADWNEELLAEHFVELSALDLNFSLDVTGFEISQIDLMIENKAKSPTAETDPADDLHSISSGPPICKPGDIWLLGRHRLLCGNSLDSASYTALLKGELADLVFTDPPYNVRINGHASGLGRTRHREFAMASGEIGRAEFTDFLSRICLHLKRFSQSGAIHFLCMDWRHASEMLEAGSAIYAELKNICVWVKHNAGMGSFYRSQHEFIFAFKAGKSSHQNNIQLGGLDGTEPTFGRIERQTISDVPPMRDISFICIRRSNPSPWLPTQYSIVPVAVTWCSILFWAAVRRWSQRNASADGVLVSKLIRLTRIQ
jgi:hypothetical protein